MKNVKTQQGTSINKICKIFKSSCLELIFKKAVLKNFAKFTGVLESLLTLAQFFFPVSFAKFFRTGFFSDHIRETASINFLRKKLPI